MKIYEDADLFIEAHESVIPWVKIFTRTPYKEVTDCPENLQLKLWQTALTVEKVMRSFYTPDKVNIASFGNMLPHVHIHVQARFQNDPWFPEPTWGSRQRETPLSLPNPEYFYQTLCETLKEKS